MFEETGEKIYHLSEVIKYRREYQILVAAADGEVRQNLDDQSLEYIDIPNYLFPFIKEYAELFNRIG